MKHAGIIGFGRFGKVLYRLLKDDFQVVVYVRNIKIEENLLAFPSVKFTSNLNDIYSSCTVIFYSVPIRSFESVIKSHKKYIKNHTLIDVLSVKMLPEKIITTYIKKPTEVILTHPMFGPDSSKCGFSHLPIVMHNHSAQEKTYNYWKEFFTNKELRVVEMTPKEHDKKVAYSQGITHFIGRMLHELPFSKTSIDTVGARKLHEVTEQTCNDSWELFYDLQQCNPFTKSMRISLGNAYDHVYRRLLSKKINKNNITFGIQGGKGSFNEQALIFYTKTNFIQGFTTKYLFTSQKVLKNLHEGNIDFGICAIHNSVGGVVEETIQAVAKYKVLIEKEFSIPIEHFLMKKRGVLTSAITTIMAHPQVFKQCAHTLSIRYPHLQIKSGTGNLIDTAAVTLALSKGKIPSTVAVLGPKILSTFYNFEIIDSNLQDMKQNKTSFLILKRF